MLVLSSDLFDLVGQLFEGVNWRFLWSESELVSANQVVRMEEFVQHNTHDHKCISSCATFVGKVLISSNSRKSDLVTMSTNESEVIAAKLGKIYYSHALSSAFSCSLLEGLANVVLKSLQKSMTIYKTVCGGS